MPGPGEQSERSETAASLRRGAEEDRFSRQPPQPGRSRVPLRNMAGEILRRGIRDLLGR